MSRARGLGGLVAILLLTGCASADLAKVARELAKDPASVCVTVTTLYGKATLARSALAAGSVRCTPDGMAVDALPGAPAR